MNIFQKQIEKNEIVFILSMWLLSRVVIIVAMQLITPLVVTSPVHTEWTWDSRPHDFIPGYIPTPGWELFSHWDGKWYRTIATEGYEYVNDGQQHSIAFFPLFPFLVFLVMKTGLPFEVAGVLVNNLAFLAALFTLYFWARETQGIRAARWVVAVFVWYPSSLYGTVTYTEGLFLLLTTQSLQAFDKHQYGWAAFWGALASGTRVPGVMLTPAFLFVAWKERRPAIAYFTGLVASGGLLLFCLYGTFRFNNPLAFMQTQTGWEHTSWLDTVKDALVLDQPSILLVAALAGFACMLWFLRSKLPPVAIAFACCVLLLLVFAGNASFYRYTYGIVTLSFGIGVLLSRQRRIGYAVIGFFAVFLFLSTMDFASWDWVRWD